MSDQPPDPLQPQGSGVPGAGDASPEAKKTQPARRHSRRTVLAVGIPAVAATAVVGAGFAPRPTGPARETGDLALAEALRPHLRGHRQVAAAILDGDTRIAGFGCDQHQEFEIGSVTKTFTGALVMTAIERGELRLDSTVEEVLGERAAGSELAGATVSDLVTHTAGLPTIAPNLAFGSVVGSFLRKDLYRGTPDEVVDAALAAPLNEPGTHSYSNLSISLAAHLVAHVAGQPWEQLVSARITEPLGLGHTWAPLLQQNLDRSAPRGHDAGGRRAQAWTMEGYAPSGGIRSNALDMSAYLASMIDGSNPGVGGIQPIAPAGEGQQVGVTWFTTELPGGGTAIWHNGMTGGYASFCGWDPDSGRGVLLLTNTATAVTELGLGILDRRVEI